MLSPLDFLELALGWAEPLGFISLITWEQSSLRCICEDMDLSKSSEGGEGAAVDFPLSNAWWDPVFNLFLVWEYFTGEWWGVALTIGFKGVGVGKVISAPSSPSNDSDKSMSSRTHLRDDCSHVINEIKPKDSAHLKANSKKSRGDSNNQGKVASQTRKYGFWVLCYLYSHDSWLHGSLDNMFILDIWVLFWNNFKFHEF